MVCSNFWKLDKIDKIVISLILILILVTFFSIFDCFCYASSIDVPVGYYKLQQQLYLTNSALSLNNNVVEVQYSNIYKIDLLNGANYIFLSSPYPFSYVLSNEDLALGDNVDNISSQEPNSAIYLYNNGDFKYLYLSYYSDNNVDVYTNANGMVSAISDLSSTVGYSTLFGVVDSTVPFLFIAILFALGYFVMLCITSNLARGKGRL